MNNSDNGSGSGRQHAKEERDEIEEAEGAEGERESGRAKGRRRWTTDLDSMLIEEAAAHRAHVARHGEGQALFTRVAETLNAKEDFRMKTDWKNAKDRLTLLLKKHKEEGGKNSKVSGIEAFDGTTQLLDDMCLEVEAMKREIDAKRKKDCEKEETKRRDGKMIQERALKRFKRASRSSGGRSEYSNELEGKRKRRRSDSLVEASDEGMARINKIEEGRMKLLERKLELEERRFQEEVKSREQQAKIEMRKLEIQEKEKDAQITQQKAMMDLIASLTKKIG